MKIHKARKNHRCGECGRLIPIGSRYWRDYDEGNYHDDLGHDNKTHTNCLEFENQPKVSTIEVQKMNSKKTKQTQTESE